MSAERKSDPQHWNMLYQKYRRNQLGWYADLLSTSLDWVLKYAPDPSSSILEMGGGSSTLVDELCGLSYSAITVVDLSEVALTEARTRLDEQGLSATLIVGDARDTKLNLPRIDLWHDRAAFHFLHTPEEIADYLFLLMKSLKSNGFLVLGLFSENAPLTCSGLPVNRYSLDGLKTVFSPHFQLLESHTEVHVTPGGIEQEYLYTAWKRES